MNLYTNIFDVRSVRVSPVRKLPDRTYTTCSYIRTITVVGEDGSTEDITLFSNSKFKLDIDLPDEAKELVTTDNPSA